MAWPIWPMSAALWRGGGGGRAPGGDGGGLSGLGGCVGGGGGAAPAGAKEGGRAGLLGAECRRATASRNPLQDHAHRHSARAKTIKASARLAFGVVVRVVYSFYSSRMIFFSGSNSGSLAQRSAPFSRMS